MFIGGSQTSTDEISPEVPAWMNWAMLAVGVAAATILAGPLVAALGTVGGLAGGEVGSLVGGHFFGEGSDGQKWSMLAGGLLGGMAGAKGGAAFEGRFFPEPAVVPSEMPESNPDLAP